MKHKLLLVCLIVILERHWDYVFTDSQRDSEEGYCTRVEPEYEEAWEGFRKEWVHSKIVHGDRVVTAYGPT